jgi:hypothetical protein
MQSYVIKTLIRMLENKELVLPAMQRPFVWEEERILRLMDSLLRRFPLGTILVWSTTEAQRFRAFRAHAQTGEQPVFTFENASPHARKLYVLDGQQRLTTLLLALKGTLDDRQLYLDALSGCSDGKDPGEMYYDFRFLGASEAEELNAHEPTDGHVRQHFVPCDTFLKIEPIDAPMVAARIAKERGYSDEEQELLSSTYTRASGCLVSEKALQVHVIDEHGETHTPIEEILEIFVRVNSGGLVLNKSDLLMSLLDLSWNDVQPALMRISREVSDGAPLQVTRDMVLKASLLFINKESRFHKLVKDRKAVERIAPKLAGAMEPVRKAWKTLRVILLDNCKIRTPRFFRQASNALLPFAVYLAHNPSPERLERHRMVAGIYITLMTGVFGSAEARMGYFTRKHCRSEGEFPLDQLAEVVSRTRWVFNLESLLSSHLDLTLNIAHGGVILDDNPDELERDHIFPKALLARQEWPDGKINHYANFHFLRQKDNRNKTDRPPHEWFRAPGKSPAYTDQEMEDRLLSWDLIEPDAFETMLETRGQRIREKALQMFHMTEDEFSGLF